MGFLNGDRSRFPNNIDQIKELYDLPVSLKQDAIRYHELISKQSLSDEETQELRRLTGKLEEYIITAEDRNYFGDVVIKIQKFFKHNVQDFILERKQEITTFVSDKKNEIVNFVTQKSEELTQHSKETKTEFNSYIDESELRLTKFINDKTDAMDSKIKTTEGKITELSNLVTNKKEEITEFINTTRQQISSFVSSKQSEITELLENTKTGINMHIQTKTEEINTSISSALQKITELTSLVRQKSDEITDIINNKKNEITDFVRENKEQIHTFISGNKQDIENFVNSAKQQANNYTDTKKNEIQVEIDKFKDFGLWSPTKQYYTKNIVHYEGNAYLAKKDNLNATPVTTENDNWLLLTIKGDTGYSVNLQPKDTYNTSTSYIANDLVNYKGSLYYCKKNCNGISPDNTTYWGLFLAGSGEILSNLKTNHKLSLVGAVNENKTRIDGKADKTHTHNSLEIYDDDELLLANNFNNPAGNIYINYRGANSPIKNYILGAGISEENNNNLANLKVKELLEGDTKLIDKYAPKDGSIFQPKILPNGTDLNNIKEAGVYVCDLDTKAETILNKASGNSKAFILIVIKPNSDSVTQYFTYYKVGNDKTYVRGFYRSWNNWSEVAYTKDVAVLNRENIFTQNQKFEINKAPILQLADSGNANSIRWNKVNTDTIFGAIGVHADGTNPIKMYFGFGNNHFSSPALMIEPNGDLKAKNKIYSNNKEVALKEDITRMGQALDQETSAPIILSKLKTVDGTGSGLDADLLDGKNSSDFVTVDKENKFTVSQTLKNVDLKIEVPSKSQNFIKWVHADNPENQCGAIGVKTNSGQQTPMNFYYGADTEPSIEIEDTGFVNVTRELYENGNRVLTENSVVYQSPYDETEIVFLEASKLNLANTSNNTCTVFEVDVRQKGWKSCYLHSICLPPSVKRENTHANIRLMIDNIRIPVLHLKYINTNDLKQYTFPHYFAIEPEEYDGMSQQNNKEFFNIGLHVKNYFRIETERITFVDRNMSDNKYFAVLQVKK